MERLTRYDVAEYKGVAMVVVESDLLPPDPAVVVIPLLRDYPAVKGLNPEILHDGERLVLATRLIAAVRAAVPVPWPALRTRCGPPRPGLTRPAAPVVVRTCRRSRPAH